MPIILISIAVIFFLIGIASAAKIKGILKLAARVPVMCAFVTISSVNFGSYIGTETSGTGAMTVNCALGTNYAISLGTGGSGTYDPRQMQSGSDLLNYNLYTDNSYATRWEYQTVNDTGTGSDQNYSIFGKIPAGQNPPVGSYSDSIVVIIDY